jgi:TetR/AcrR family transcriptional regulator
MRAAAASTNATTRAKKERSSADTKRRILAAAEKEFAAKGFDGARLSAIAKAANVQQALIHHYFEDKDGLHAEVLRAGVATMAEAAWKILKEMDAPPHKGKRRTSEELRVLTDAFVDLMLLFFTTNRAFLSILRHEGEKATKIVAETVRPVFEAVVAKLEEMKRRGEIRKDIDPRHLVLSCVAMAAFPFQEEMFVRAIWPVEWEHSDQLGERHRQIVDMILARILP